MAGKKMWWRDLPCHYNPSWKLHEISQLDINKLKRHIQRDTIEFMDVETLLYAAFLEVPVGSLYNLSLPSISKAHKHLLAAEQYIAKNYESNEDAKVGYGIVINSCRMWTTFSTRIWEKKLQDLNQKRKSHPGHAYYISAVRAFTLSRLGPKWLKEASKYYEHATSVRSEKAEWSLQRASVLVRLVRQEDPTMKSNESIKSLNLPEEMVTKLLNLDENFHRARALRIQILFAKGKLDEAKQDAKIFTFQVVLDTANTNIAVKICKYYKDIENHKFALEAVNLLPRECRTAEVYFLIGDLNKGKAETLKQIEQKRKKWKIALKSSEDALKLDARHYPALRLRAEVNSRLGNYDDAKEQYADLLNSMLLDKSYLHKHKFHTLDTVLSLPPVIREKILNDETYINFLSALLNTAFDYYSDKTDGGISFTEVARQPVEKCESALKKICESSNVESGLVFLAKLKLAHFYLRQGKFNEAERLFLELKTSKDSDVSRENIEVIWGLFKCYLGERNYEKANERVEEIGKTDQTFYCVEELKADIFMKKVNSQLLEDKNALDFFPEHTDQEDEPLHENHRLLEKAIEMGSLEACDTFFKIKSLHNFFFVKSMQIPRFIAKIERVIKGKVRPVHTHVPERTRDDIKTNIEKLLTYPETDEINRGLSAYQKRRVLNVHTKLSKLRRSILQFEFVAAEVEKKKTDWNDSCEAAFTEVMLTARFLLDHIISDYQDALVKDEDNERLRSLFCIFDDPGIFDKDEAQKKVKAWLTKNFPKCENEVPKNIIDMLVKVQPMYDKANLWLSVLHHFVNDLKHTGGGGGKKAEKQSKFELLKDEKKENLALTSCKEVENIVLTILEEITRLYQKANEKQKASVS